MVGGASRGLRLDSILRGDSAGAGAGAGRRPSLGGGQRIRGGGKTGSHGRVPSLDSLPRGGTETAERGEAECGLLNTRERPLGSLLPGRSP